MGIEWRRRRWLAAGRLAGSEAEQQAGGGEAKIEGRKKVRPRRPAMSKRARASLRQQGSLGPELGASARRIEWYRCHDVSHVVGRLFAGPKVSRITM